MKFVTLCGKLGVGKTTVAQELATQYDLSYISTKQWIEQYIGPGKPREAYIHFTKELHERSDPGAFARLLVQSLPEGKYVLDRMVTTEDIQYLREQGSFILLVQCEENVRQARILARDDQKDRLEGTAEEKMVRLATMDARDLTNIEQIMALANHVFDSTHNQVKEDINLRELLTAYLRDS